MNHFELFELPVSFHPDPAQVKKKFYELSRAFHPDFHGQAGEDEQEALLERSSQVNAAYRIFQQPDAVIRYVLQLQGLLEEEEKYALAPDFLLEVLDLNEQLMEAEEPAEKEKLQSAIAALEAESLAPVLSILQQADASACSREELLQVKEYYYRKKYLDRILAGLH